MGEVSASDTASVGSEGLGASLSQIDLAQKKVDILILGAGWTSTFLIPILKTKNISYVATSTTGRDGTLKFKFQADSDDGANRERDCQQYEALPTAKTVLITFPLKGPRQSTYLQSSYVATHDPKDAPYQFIQLGSTGIWTIPNQEHWVTRHSKYNTTNDRAIAEDELRKLGGCVLNLSGLWGGERQPRHWIDRVAPTKEKLKEKTSLHMIHGTDVARAIIAVHQKFKFAAGQRFMLTDLQVYDWWALLLRFAGEIDEINQSDDRVQKQIQWVGELMGEQKVRALPRSMEQLGRCYDTREFWTLFDLMPVRSGL